MICREPVAVAGREGSGLKRRTGFVVLLFVVVAVVVMVLELILVLLQLSFTVGGKSRGLEGGRSRASPADAGLRSSRIVAKGIPADAGRILKKWECSQVLCLTVCPLGVQADGLTTKLSSRALDSKGQLRTEPWPPPA
jgi:hypothetical protein